MAEKSDAKPAELPVITYEQGASIHFNGGEIRVIALRPGHTDGDRIVGFTGANVVHMGDPFFAGKFPFINLGSGGDVAGFAANIEQALVLIPADAKVIPGHGPLATVDDLKKFHAMLVETTGVVKRAIAAGKSLEQVKAAGLPKHWQDWGHRVHQRWPLVGDLLEQPVEVLGLPAQVCFSLGPKERSQDRIRSVLWLRDMVKRLRGLFVSQQLPDQFGTPKDVSGSKIAQNLHVTVEEDVNLGPLVHQSYGDRHRVGALPREGVLVPPFVEAFEQSEQRMALVTRRLAGGDAIGHGKAFAHSTGGRVRKCLSPPASMSSRNSLPERPGLGSGKVAASVASTAIRRKGEGGMHGGLPFRIHPAKASRHRSSMAGLNRVNHREHS